jgi:AhpD family alkylhydroperoxidase
MTLPTLHGVPLDTSNPWLRLLFFAVRRKFGRVPGPLRGYARSPWTLLGVMGMELGLGRAGSVDARLKGLAELRVAALVGCAFCLDIGSAVVRQSGVSETQLVHLNDYRESDVFSELERAVLAYADGMTRTPLAIAAECQQVLARHFSEQQLVELTCAIAHENLRARMNHALGYGAEGYSKGGVCALPAPLHGAAARPTNGL